MDARIGELAALGTALCWTVTALSFEAAGKRIGSLTVNIIRLVMAAALFALYGWIVRGIAIPLDASAYAWTWLGLSGLVGFVIGDLFLFQAFVDIGARVSMLIYSSVPPLTALMARFVLDERLTAQGIAGMALTVLGIAIVVLRRPAQAPRPARLAGPSAGTPRLAPAGDAAAGAAAADQHGLPVAPFADPEGEASEWEVPEHLAEHEPATPPATAPAPGAARIEPADARDPGADDGATQPGPTRDAGQRPTRHPHHIRGALFAFGGALGQAGGLILGRLGAGVTLNPFAATQIRVFAGIIGFTIVFTLTRRWRSVATAVRDAGAMRRVAAGAFFGPFLGVSLGLYGAQNTSAGIASTIMALVPVLIIVPSVLVFKERVTVREVLGAVVAVVGVGLLFL